MPKSLCHYTLEDGTYLKTLWSRDLVRSCDKLKPVYLYYHSAYDHQTWQDAKLPWAILTHKVTLLFGHVDHVTRSCGKLKSLYFHYHSVYGNQTCQVGDLR